MNMEKGETQLIVSIAKEYGCNDRQIAYILATARHESAGTMEPVLESLAPTVDSAIRRLDDWFDNKGGKDRVSHKYWEKDKDGKSWLGRGLIQLTHKENYEMAAEELSIDFVADPDLVMEPENSARILVQGMLEGWFRTDKANVRHTLSRYVNDQGFDFYKARSVVNGDRGDVPKGQAMNIGTQISRIAQEYYDKLIGNTRSRLINFNENEVLEESVQGGMPVLRFGASGSAVQILQEKLKSRGYAPGSIDGEFGQETRAAVITFQANNDLQIDGVVGPQTWASLESEQADRPISKKRREAKVSDLRSAGSRTIAKADRAQVGGGLLASVGGLAGVSELLGDAEEASGTLGSIKAQIAPLAQFLQDNWVIVLIGVGILVLTQADGIKKERLDDHQSGANMGR